MNSAAIQKTRHSVLYFASVVSLGGFLFGFDASVISGVVSFIVPQFGLNDWQLGLVVGAPTLAGIIAALGGALLADVIGRKRVLIILALLYAVSAVASAFAPNYQVLVIARFLGGLAFASLGIAPMYIGEIAPREKRGMLVTGASTGQMSSRSPSPITAAPSSSPGPAPSNGISQAMPGASQSIAPASPPVAPSAPRAVSAWDTSKPLVAGSPIKVRT